MRQPVPARATVLVADPHPVVRNVVRAVLESRGLRVIACADRREALECSRAHAAGVELLIASVATDDLSGFELACLVAAERPDIRILLLAADDTSPLLAGRLQIACLQKPFGLTRFYEQVCAVLAGPPARCETEPYPHLSWEELLSQQMARAEREYASACRRYRRVTAAANSSPAALKSATAVHERASRNYRRALAQFSAFVLEGRLPDTPPGPGR